MFMSFLCHYSIQLKFNKHLTISDIEQYICHMSLENEKERIENSNCTKENIKIIAKGCRF